MGSGNISNKQLYELINSKFNELTERINNNTDKTTSYIEKLEEENRHLKERVELLENKVRKNNVAVFGLTELRDGNLMKESLKQLNSHLKLEKKLQEADLNNIYKPKTRGRESPVILELNTYLRKQDIFQKVANLKGTGIKIVHDLSKQEREVNKFLWTKYKEAKAEKLEAKIKGKSLVINGKKYDYNSLLEEERKKIEHNQEYRNDFENSAEDEEDVTEEEEEGNSAVGGVKPKTKTKPRYQKAKRN